MTGKHFLKGNIFRHDFCQVFKKNLGILFVGLLVFLVFIPFSTAGITGDSIFEITTTHEQMKFRLIGENFVIPVYIAVVLYGTILGISTFRFVLDKPQVTLYFSIGLTREKLFFSRFLTIVINMATVIFIPMGISLVLNRMALGNYNGMTNCFLYVSSGLFLQGMIACMLSMIACMLAGTLIETLLYDVLFLFGISGVLYSVNQLWLKFVWGNAYGAVTYTGTQTLLPSLLNISKSYNPLLFFYQQVVDYSMFYRGLTKVKADDFLWIGVINWTFVLIVLTFLAVLTLKRRKAEIATISGLNKFWNLLLIMISGFVVFTMVDIMFSSGNQVVSFLLAMLATTLVMMIFTHQKTRIQMFVESFVKTLVLAGIVGIVCIGSNQYLKKLPNINQVKSATISYLGNPSYISGGMSGSSSGSSFYMLTDYTFDNKKDLEMIRSLQNKLIEMGMKEKEENKEFSKTVVPYDIRISWTLKNGQEKVWYYDRASLEILEDFLVLDESDKVNENIDNVITGKLEEDGQNSWSKQAYTTGDVYLADIWYAHSYKLNISEDARKTLLEALSKDIQSQSVEQRYFPNKEAIGTILFTPDGESDTENYSWHLGNAIIYVTDEFSHTLDFLKRNHLMSCMEFDGEIENIVLQPYNPYDGINGRKTPMSNLFLGYCSDSLDNFAVQADFGEKQPIKDKNRIEKLVPRLRSVYNMTKPGYLAAVKIVGSSKYVYKYLPGELE